MSKKPSKFTVEEIQAYLHKCIAKMCSLPVDEVAIDEPVIEFGIDSLIVANISSDVQKKFNIDLPIDEIGGGASIREIAAILFEQISIGYIAPIPLHNVDFEKEELVFANIQDIDEGFYNVKKLPQYKKLAMQKVLFKKAKVYTSPFYRTFESASTTEMSIDGAKVLNFGSYNYLGFNYDNRVNEAAIAAINTYGTSASSSRIVSGEKSLHIKLEKEIASLYEVDDAMVFVSGYATNVSVISSFLDENDLIIHDSLAHNSIIVGSEFSKAKRLSFAHNNLNHLEKILNENRLKYEKVLIVVEGLYSMDGDTVPLAELIKIKHKYKCLLMIDEAHSIGVLGDTGRGIREHAKVAATDVDIWMGTLSKTFSGCGGYIAGSFELIEYLKFYAPGFIFSVGLAPPLAAASIMAINLLKNNTNRVLKLQHNSRYFLEKARAYGFDTGLAEGYAIIPIIVGNTFETAKITNNLFARGVNAQPIIYPAVEEKSSRIRFFISSEHTIEQMDKALVELYHAYEDEVHKRHEHSYS